ncbi:hypothetical protein ACE2AJ_17595 [Aquihabitans daechungensis]|uniref:hypothetical protein n=1 Tax=Aquihabitans daechungensis TaxID=1052257 RepID=UPI003BA0EFDC
MAAGAGGAHGEHGAFDRRFVVGVLAVLVLLGVGSFALVRRADSREAKRSRPGDACPVRGSDRPGSNAALDGMVAFDRATGEVLWTNVVPYGSRLGTRGEELVVIRAGDAPERVIDPTSGAVTSCGRRPNDRGVAEVESRIVDPAAGFEVFDLGSVTVEAVGNGADVRAIGTDGREQWAMDAGNPAVGGRATVSHPVHSAALTPERGRRRRPDRSDPRGPGLTSVRRVPGRSRAVSDFGRVGGRR